MGSLVDQVYAAFGEEARRRGIDYACDANGGGPVIVSDGDRVFQIVSNLLNNAFRWTPDGGRIELALVAANGTISVSVADTGPGIKPADQERIFRPVLVARRRRHRARPGDRPRAGGRARRPDRAREPAGRGQPVRPEAARHARRHRISPMAVAVATAAERRARRSRGHAPEAVVEEPAPLRRAALRGRSSGDATRWLEAVRRVRRLLRGIERRVPRERRPGRRARPRAPGEAAAAGRERRASGPRRRSGSPAVLAVAAIVATAFLGPVVRRVHGGVPRRSRRRTPAA